MSPVCLDPAHPAPAQHQLQLQPSEASLMRSPHMHCQRVARCGTLLLTSCSCQAQKCGTSGRD